MTAGKHRSFRAISKSCSGRDTHCEAAEGEPFGQVSCGSTRRKIGLESNEICKGV
jgi:hypothetical protein